MDIPNTKFDEISPLGAELFHAVRQIADRICFKIFMNDVSCV